MLDKHIVDFNESLIGLRDFVELIEPFLNDKVEEHENIASTFIDLTGEEPILVRDGKGALEI